MGAEAVGKAAQAVHEALLARGQTVGCAESLTGGELAAALSSTPGASGTFAGAVVTYATALKRSLLGVSAERVVSAECAGQMAAGVRGLLSVDWALSTTGVAGPVEQEGQPVGTVYVGLAGPSGTSTVRLVLGGERATIRSATCEAATRLLLEAITRG